MSCDLRERALAQGSWQNRVSHLRSYISFTIFFNVEDFPLHLGVLIRFISLLSRGPGSYDSACNMISSLKYFTEFLDPPSVKLFDSVYVSASLKGLKALLDRPARQKLPLSIKHLCLFYNYLDLSSMVHLSCWCAMLLAFFGCFRLSNLVPLSKGKFDPFKHLIRDDLVFEKDMILIFYKWSKTNQHCRKVSWIPIFSVSDHRFDIKSHFMILFKHVNVSRNSPLFSYSESEFHSRHSLVSLLDKCLFHSGLKPSDFSWHSFRRGSAMFAFELGIADSAVQLLGDWSSMAFKRYLEYTFVRKSEIANKIAKSFDKQVKYL